MARPVMGVRRGGVEIVADILSVCQHGATDTTAIMSGANLNYQQLERYVVPLSTGQYLKRDISGRFVLTQKGQDARAQMATVEELLVALRSPETNHR